MSQVSQVSPVVVPSPHNLLITHRVILSVFGVAWCWLHVGLVLLECWFDADLTLILVDASDSLVELQRKIETTQREVMERQRIDEDLLDEPSTPHVVLTKIDLLSEAELRRVSELVEDLGYPSPVAISSLEDTGIDALQLFIRKRLFGEPCTLSIHPPATSGDDASERIVADVYENGMVESNDRAQDGTVQMVAWLASPQQAKLKARWLHRIDIK